MEIYHTQFLFHNAIFLMFVVCLCVLTYLYVPASAFSNVIHIDININFTDWDKLPRKLPKPFSTGLCY